MSSLRATGQRDNQRQRLYDAERDFEAGASPSGRRLLYGGKKVASTGSVSIEACQRYVDHVTTAAWFQTRWGYQPYTVKHKVHGSATHSWGNQICLPPWARTEWAILHEIAHGLTPEDCAWHGPEFAGVFLTLVRYQLGSAAVKSLRESFKKHRVRYSMSRVPSPGASMVRKRESIRTSAVIERERIQSAKARRERELTDGVARRRSAASIRALVKAGHFGPAGSTERKAALTTARALER